MSNDEFEQKPSRWLWSLAALAALALHLGGVALAALGPETKGTAFT